MFKCFIYIPNQKADEGKLQLSWKGPIDESQGEENRNRKGVSCMARLEGTLLLSLHADGIPCTELFLSLCLKVTETSTKLLLLHDEEKCLSQWSQNIDKLFPEQSDSYCYFGCTGHVFIYFYLFTGRRLTNIHNNVYKNI